MRDYAKSTVYQIYIKSFCDSNGDGIGDLNGIRSKLGYIRSLGVDYVWITPFFLSPMKDNGYDVADYYSINPMFGTMEDAESMIREAEEQGLGLMFDMVFNHTSTEHEWFKKALTGDQEYMDYYIFREGRTEEEVMAADNAEGKLMKQLKACAVDGSDGRRQYPPTNWISKFGGNAWIYVPHLNKWYLHLFDPTQADLNWDNPKVREGLKEVIRFWKAKGLKGFRFDVVNLISKPAVFEDDFEGDGRRFYTDGPHVHEYLQELVRDGGIDGMVTVGEMSSTSLDNCVRYTRQADHELGMAFSFHHLKVDYKNGDKWALQPADFGKLKDLFKLWQEGMQEEDGWNAVFWCNHDQPRAVSRFGDDKQYWKESARMLAMLIHLMRGTPYIYQGEELGQTNTDFTQIEQFQDVESSNYYRILMEGGCSAEEALHIVQERSRDNGRTPMQWDGSEHAGFTTGQPWLGIPANHSFINTVSEEADQDSILNFYRKLVQLRKDLPVISEGNIRFLETGDDRTAAYVREYDGHTLTAVFNLTGETIELAGTAVGAVIDAAQSADAECLAESYSGRKSGELRPFEAFAYMV